MIHAFSLGTAATVLAGLFIATSATADDAASVAEPPAKATREELIATAIQVDTEAAKTVLKRSADFLAAQQKFSFTAQLSHDVLQPNGQKLQFGGVREITVRRPDRLRVESRTRQGEHRTLYFDGEKISIDLPDDNAYISVSKPGTLDAAIDYLVVDLDTPAPLHDFLKSNFYTDVADHIRSGYYVGTDTLDDRTCSHLAFRLAEVDVQVWVDESDEPLPCGVVITYKREPESPQFRASFDDWDLSPKSSDRVFSFKPPSGAEQLSLQAAIAAATEAE